MQTINCKGNLILLAPGTTRYILGRRPVEVEQAVYPPMQPDPYQCVHYYEEELSEGVELHRCLFSADPTKRNGWLCPEHDEVLDLMAQRRVKKVWVNFDQELIDSIIKSEDAALANTVRDRVTVGRLHIDTVSTTID